MKEILADKRKTIYIGRSGENKAQQIRFDISDLIRTYGEGTVTLVAQRNEDTVPYPVEVIRDGNDVIWNVSEVDTEYEGKGYCELRYMVGDTLAKSALWSTFVEKSLKRPSEDCPETHKDYIEWIVTAKGEAERAASSAKSSEENAKKYADNARDASVKVPYIGDNGSWYVWDIESSSYIDTGIPAEGKTPVKGIDYFDGKDGYTPVKGVDYFDGTDGKDGKDGANGKDGADGYTPVKGTDYYTDSDKAEMVNSVKAAFEPEVQAINQTAEQAKNIAKGRATGYVFDTLEDLDTALTDAGFVANLVLGDNLYIRATNVPDYWWDGTTKQQLETEKPDLSGLVKDVQINGATAVENGVANIPIASTAKPGAVRVGAQFNIGTNGILTLASGNQKFISERSPYNFPISTTNYDYAVKAAMCDGKGAAWTADEQSAARERMGAVSPEDVSTLINEALGVIENGSY